MSLALVDILVEFVEILLVIVERSLSKFVMQFWAIVCVESMMFCFKAMSLVFVLIFVAFVEILLVIVLKSVTKLVMQFWQWYV
jgi:hypothetical protein